MFGLDENEKQLKELLAACGCEASVFKSFQKGYERANRRVIAVENRYDQCLADTKQVQLLARNLERIFQSQGQNLGESERKIIQDTAKELRSLQGNFSHEFIISEYDKEFHSTYASLIELLPKYAKSGENKLLVQSEVENLLALLKENLERKRPDLLAYSYFLSSHKDKELCDMSAEKKRGHIVELFWSECTKDLCDELKRCCPDKEVQLRRILRAMQVEFSEI